MTDRELDALVAEKVYGLIRHAIPKNSMPDVFGKLNAWPREDSFGLATPEGYAVYFVGHMNDSYRPGDGRELWPGKMPHYSTKIEDAWMVVEKVRELGFPFVLESRGDMNAPGRWWAYFEKTIGDRSCNGYSHEAPKAICLAALKAVGKGDGA